MKKTKTKKKVVKDPILVALEILIELVKDLKDDIRHLQKIPPPLGPQIPADFPHIWDADRCVDGGSHEYPFPWHATIPPPCKKCGRTAPWTQITCCDTAPVHRTTLTDGKCCINNKEDELLTVGMVHPTTSNDKR